MQATAKWSAILTRPKGSDNAGLLMLLFIAILLSLVLYQQRPLRAQSAEIPLTEFSSARARKHLSAIAAKPRPLGSAAHDEARDYIIKELTALGVEPEIQRTFVVTKGRYMPFTAGNVENILARLKGLKSGKAIVLLGHYDSVPFSPGASDDGAAVAAMLETLRALRAGPPLDNDVILLFSDGEESGLLGAEAFVREHAWAKEVGLVLNFEARGNSGPSVMFETSADNGRLIREYAKAASGPVANSLTQEIYRLLPNNTDLSVFKTAGLAGLNFAYVKGFSYYHAPIDNLQTIDERSLQHHGANALSLTRHFGRLPLINMKERDAVYFDILGSVLIHYPGAWVTPLTIAAILVFTIVAVSGFRRGRLTVKGLILGFFAMPLCAVMSGLLVTFIWVAIRSLHPSYAAMFMGEPYNGYFYRIGFAALTVALTSILYIWLGRKSALYNLIMGALLCWLVLLIITTLFMPGGSYLLCWPVIFNSIALGLMFRSQGPPKLSTAAVMALALGAASALLLVVPVIQLLFVALPVGASGIPVVVIVLLSGLLIPHASIASGINRWLLPVGAAAAFLAFVVAGSLTSGFNQYHPKPNSIFYALNADENEAIWASSDNKPDEWTRQFLASDASKGPLAELFPWRPGSFLKSKAQVAPLDAPNVALASDSMAEGQRLITLRITSPRQAPIICVYVEQSTDVLGASINGKPVTASYALQGQADAWNIINYNVSGEGIEFSLYIKPSTPLRLRVVDISMGLPALPGYSFSPRPDYMVPRLYPGSDSTYVSKSFTF